MTSEILTVKEMTAADAYAAAHGTPQAVLMEHAGRAVADEIGKRWTQRRVAVLCGPGNNGGDGKVVARLLQERGWELVERFEDAALVVDALFGAGLSRPLEGEAARFARASKDLTVVAVDVPSGLHGDTGRPLGEACVAADLTVTFFRKKPAHVLMPGRALCGEIVVADIGIPAAAAAGAALFENGPQLWDYPWPRSGGHKYGRGHCVVVSGPAHATGAARLAARGALRIGAGLVSVASPHDAVAVNAAHLTAVMVKPFGDLAELLTDARLNAVVIGPGAGVGAATCGMVEAVLASHARAVLDADALTSFKDAPQRLFTRLRKGDVLTPHAGEFQRLFPDLSVESRIESARAAAARAGCVVLLKGADTVIAAPDGWTAVNTDAPATLATAGSGDVLAGFIGGLLAQGVEAGRAAAMAAWLHGAAAQQFGPGLIAEDLPDMLPAALRALKKRAAPVTEA